MWQNFTFELLVCCNIPLYNNNKRNIHVCIKIKDFQIFEINTK